MTISRSHDGTVYSGTGFVLNVSISFRETLTEVDIALAIGWSKTHNAYNEQNIVNNDRIRVSNVSIGGWATLTYSPIAISDRGLLVATVTASPLDELFIEPVSASSSHYLNVKGMACIIISFGKYCRYMTHSWKRNF